MKNKLVFLCLSLIIIFGVGFLILPDAKSNAKVYYSGEAINFNNKVIFGSTNMNGVEIFALENKKIVRTASFSSYSLLSSTPSDFSDLIFNVENDSLYVYLVDGRYLHKYDITNPYNPRLVDKVKDNSWDWFIGLTKYSDKVATIGTNGIKVWNSDTQIINSFKFKNNYHYNIKFSASGNFIFNIDKGNLQVINAINREEISTIPIVVNEEHNRSVYNDMVSSQVIVVEDNAVTAFNFNGKEIKSYSHTSDFGYDIDSLANSDYVYFSDGLGVVKLDKNTFKAVDWVFTTNLVIDNGWAMDINVVPQNDGEKIIVFNNSSIIVLDKNLEMLDYYEASEKDVAPVEKLFLAIDKNRGAAGSQISLRGGGFGLNEDLLINFANKKYNIQADNQGRFTKIITVPDVDPVRTDIKVVGQFSGLHYSVAFDIE
ncbi:MAG: hypothetical protein ABH830_01275 [Patescibacteria group bacterium]